MADRSNIEWTDSTFNPWMGCTKVSPACDHCYAENLMDSRMHAVQWGAGQQRKRTSAKNWKLPMQWNAAPFYKCFTCGWRGDNPETKGSIFDGLHSCPECDSVNITRARRRVFCASLADVFDNEVPIEWRRDLFDLIELTPNLDWLLLTKRIGNVFEMVSRAKSHDWLEARKNVWLGATICNQAEADRDIPKLLAIDASVRFLSIEPLLGPVDLSAGYLPCPNADNSIMDPETGVYECCRQCDYTGLTGEFGVDWVIVGGESGPEARPMHPDWVRSLREQCQSAGVPFLFKQWGEWREPLEGEKYDTTMGRAQRVPAFIVAKTGTVHCFQNDQTANDGRVMLHVGKKKAGRLLDGVTHTEFPKVNV